MYKSSKTKDLANKLDFGCFARGKAKQAD